MSLQCPYRDSLGVADACSAAHAAYLFMQYNPRHPVGKLTVTPCHGHRASVTRVPQYGRCRQPAAGSAAVSGLSGHAACPQ